MARSPTKSRKMTRLNIYLPSPAFRRRVKAAAAKQDLTISEYCVRAIAHQLERDQEQIPALGAAVERARRFQSETFGGRVFQVSSAELIRQAREESSA